MENLKFISVVFIFLFNFSCSVFAQTVAESVYEIEDLWKKCEENAESIFSARQNFDYYDTAKKTLRILYPLSFSVSVSPDFYKNYEQYSDELEVGAASATLAQTLPGGAKVSATAAYGVNSGYRSWNPTDGYTNKGYSDYFSAQLQYSQSLNPYWLNGTSKDPEKRKVNLNADISGYNLMQAKKNAYSKVLSLYIRYRRNSRNIIIAEKEVEVLKTNLDALKSMNVSKTAFLTDVWQAEKSFGDAQNTLSSALLEKEEILNSLAELCGRDIDVSESAKLPEKTYPLFAIDPFLSNMEAQSKISESQFLIDMQNSSAVVSISGQFKDSSRLKDSKGLNFRDDTNYLQWGFTISGKINNLYGGERKLYKKKYKTERAKYEKQIDDYKKNLVAEKAYFDNLILSYEENIRDAVLNEANEKEFFEGIKKMYENGQKSQMDALLAELNYMRQKYALENLYDALWQAKWQRMQL